MRAILKSLNGMVLKNKSLEMEIEIDNYISLVDLIFKYGFYKNEMKNDLKVKSDEFGFVIFDEENGEPIYRIEYI